MPAWSIETSTGSSSRRERRKSRAFVHSSVQQTRRAPSGPAGQVGQLAEVGENAVGVHPYEATAAGARSERGTKRPWPGWVRISPRSYTIVPRLNVWRTLPVELSPSNRS